MTIASRRPRHAPIAAPKTACPPRRSFVARRRPPPWTALRCRYADPNRAAGTALTTPAMLAGMDNAQCCFASMADS